MKIVDKKPNLQGWALFSPPSELLHTLEQLDQAYRKIAPRRGTSELIGLEKILNATPRCTQLERMPYTDNGYMWAEAAIFRAAPGQTSKIKILFPYASGGGEPSGLRPLDENITVFTRGKVVKEDLEEILKFLMIEFEPT